MPEMAVKLYYCFIFNDIFGAKRANEEKGFAKSAIQWNTDGGNEEKNL